jgi:peptidoglycan/LPS O-acetylase OafA/YrhL
MKLKQAAVGAAGLDGAAILVFAAIGRANHDEGILGDNGLGLATTVWPFLVGAAAGWLIARAWKRPCDWRRTGVIVWASTLIGGMLLRVVSGQGVEVSFVIVAGLFLALFLIGWRVVSGWIAKRRGLKG